MNPSPKDRGYTASSFWDPDGSGAASVVRLIAAALLCAASFQLGRRVGRDDARYPAPGPASAVVVVERSATVKPAEPAPPSPAPGQAVGEKADVITPLNVRDPSALVMPPTGSEPPPSVALPPPTGSAPTPDALPKPSVKVYPPKDAKAKPQDRF